MTVFLLILHALVSVALLGALTHQAIAMFQREASRSTFVGRYVQVGQAGFTHAVIVLYLITVVLGALIYPAYRLDVRIPFEEMSLIWAVGVFEIKEHFGGVGLGMLPLYAFVWRPKNIVQHRRDRLMITLLLAAIVWADLIIGHVLNNIRGL